MPGKLAKNKVQDQDALGYVDREPEPIQPVKNRRKMFGIEDDGKDKKKHKKDKKKKKHKKDKKEKKAKKAERYEQDGRINDTTNNLTVGADQNDTATNLRSQMYTTFEI